MTYEQVEKTYEQKTNSIDAQYMSKALTESEYRFQLRVLDRWFESKIKAFK